MSNPLSNPCAPFFKALVSFFVLIVLLLPVSAVNAQTQTANQYNQSAVLSTNLAIINTLLDQLRYLLFLQMPYFPPLGEGPVLHDAMPDFAQSPTITSIANGSWSDPTVWSLARVPDSSDVVLINHAVSYDSTDGVAHTIGIGAGGKLAFKTDQNTKLSVGTLQVHPQGTLEVGTESNPIPAQYTAEIIIKNKPLDTVNDGQGIFDPFQFGTGILSVDGTVTMHGAVKSPTFLRLSKEPKAGDSTLTLESAPSGWQAGDKLILPDTRQLTSADVISRSSSLPKSPQWEELTVKSVLGNTVTLATSLRFDHKGARDVDGTLRFLPHVGNLSRNIIVKSENPNGTRGHTLLNQKTTVDIRYALFKDLGRTTTAILNSTIANVDGTFTIGTNQIGRYALHMHHVRGPVPAAADGIQYRLIGNAIDNSPKWGITIHQTHFGLVKDNVVYNVRGAGFVTEDATETGNVIEHNFSVRSEGSGNPPDHNLRSKGTIDNGHEGTGFWFRGSNNYIRNNVAANSRFANMMVYSFDPPQYGPAFRDRDTRPFPLYPGADITDPAQYRVAPIGTKTSPDFSNNEVYAGMHNGIEAWDITLSSTYLFRNTIGWHNRGVTIAPFYSSGIHLDGLIVRGDVAALANPNEDPRGVNSHSQAPISMERADIQGQREGAFLHAKSVVKDSYFRNIRNIVSFPFRLVSPADPKKITVRNTAFGGIEGHPFTAIAMKWALSEPTNVATRDEVFVYDYNRVPGNNFQIFHKEQHPDFIVPQTGGRVTGAPEAGLTNQQASERYGIAIAGAVAPCLDDTTYPEINGFVCPLPAADTQPPLTYNLRTTNITANSVELAWETDEPTRGYVSYQSGNRNDGIKKTSLESNLSLTHHATITGLIPDTGFAVRAYGADGAGNERIIGKDFPLSVRTNLASYPASLPPAPQPLPPLPPIVFPPAPAPSTGFAFSLSNEGPRTVEQGQSATTTITVSPRSGAPQAVTFSKGGLPNKVAASFSSLNCTPACSTVLTISAGIGAPAGVYSVIVTGTSGSAVNSTSFPLTIVTGGAIPPPIGGDTVPPTVSVSAPAANTVVSGTVAMTATAIDTIGVTRVEFLVDGAVKGIDATAPYSFSWDTENRGAHACAAGPHTHTLSAKAYDAAGNVGTSPALVVKMNNPAYCIGTPLPPVSGDAILPSVPQNVRIIPVSPTQINVTWTAATDNLYVAGYKVFRNGTQIAVTTTGYIDKGLAANTSYTYRVAAYDEAGNTSAQSPAVNATTPSSVTDKRPPKPTITAVTNVQPHSFTVSWTTDEPATAQIEYGTHQALTEKINTRFTPLDTTLRTSHTQTVSGLGSFGGGAHHYRIYARDGAGNLWLDTHHNISLKPDPNRADITRPAISNIRVVSLQPTAATITWNTDEPTTGVASTLFGAAKIFRSTQSYLVTSHQETLTGLTPNKSYIYRVSSSDYDGNQTVVDNLTFTTPASVSGDTTAPSAPANLRAEVVSAEHIHLTWNASTDNTGVTGYRIFRNNAEIATSLVAEYADAGEELSPNTTYTYQVAAFDAAGNNSARSASVTATTPEGSNLGLKINDRIRVKTALYVGPTPAGPPLGQQALSSKGTIIEGPVIAPLSGTSYTWWNINYDTGADGWSAEPFIEELPPTVQIIAPTQNQSIASSSVTIRYAIDGSPDMIDHVHLVLDSMPEVRDIDADGIHTFTNLQAGNHMVRVYLAAVDHAVLQQGGAQATANFNTTATGSFPLPPAAVLVAHWTFDEGSGTIARDASGNNHDGTLVNGPTWTQGKIGGALSFDGVDDYVDAGTFDPFTANGTVSAWVKWAGDNGKSQVIVAKRDTFAANDMRWQFRRQYDPNLSAHNNLTFQCAGVSQNKTDFNEKLDSGKWTHLVAVKDGDSAALYANGVFLDNRATKFCTDALARVLIGAGQTSGTTETFKGLIDDVRIYNRAITAQEVIALYRAGDPQATAPVLIPPSLEITYPISVSNPNSPSFTATYEGFGSLAGTHHVNLQLDGGAVVQDMAFVPFNKGSHTFTNVSPGIHTLTAYIARMDNSEIPGTRTAVTFTARVAAPVSSSLIGHWTFDEPSGAVALDSSGNGFNGQLVNGTARVPGKFGQALAFDGVNDFVTMGDVASIDQQKALTISGWMKRATSDSIVSIAKYRDRDDLSPFIAEVYRVATGLWGNNQIRFQAVQDSTNYAYVANNDTEWHHVALVFDGTHPQGANALRLRGYIDGAPRTLTFRTDASRHEISATISAELDNLEFGREYRWGPYSKGLLDDVRIYNRALSASEVKAIYTEAGVPTVPSDTISPSISLTAPLVNTTVSGTATISANAADANGIARVEFYVDGTLKSTDTTSPYAYVWDTTNNNTHACSGPHTHTLQARAYDASGNTGVSSPIVVHMNNPAYCAAPLPGVLALSAPTVGSVTANRATISWTTNLPASSRVYYFGTTLKTEGAEQDTVTRVTNHAITLQNLTACTTYQFAASSRTATGAPLRSPISSFTTLGCLGNAPALRFVEKDVEARMGDSVTLPIDNRRSLTMTVADAALAADTVLQVHQLAVAAIPAAAPLPSTNHRIAGVHAYELKALLGPSTPITTFPTAVTITVSYAPEDVQGLDVATLKLYRWTGARWTAAQNCQVNQTNRTLACTTTDFSPFVMMGTPDVTAPSSISNLSSANVDETSAQLSWTAPGDNEDEGTAASYDIRTSAAPISSATFASAEQIIGEPTPQTAGTSQSYTLVGRAPGATHYVAMKTADSAGNVSTLSNVISFTTTAAAQANDADTRGSGRDRIAPRAITDLAATLTASRVALSWTNPTNSDFVRTRIVRKEGALSPQTPTDGVRVYEGVGTSTSDTTLALGAAHTYRAFVFDRVPNYAGGNSVSITAPLEIETQITATLAPRAFPPLPLFITTPLYRGSTGAQVATLQSFLIAHGRLAAGNNTGFFGPLTEAAVKQYQCVASVLCSGAPQTTGWGSVGTRTRLKITLAQLEEYLSVLLGVLGRR